MSGEDDAVNGDIHASEVPQISSEEELNEPLIDFSQIDEELDRIRERREGVKRPFFSGPEGKTLAFGLVTAIIFGAIIVLSSTGVVMADSIAIDQSLSGTLFDPGEECEDRTGVAWLNIWVDEDHDMRVRLYNMGPENIVIHARLVEPVVENVARDIVQEDPLVLNGSLNQTEIRLDTDEVLDSEYTLVVKVYNTTGLNLTNENQTALIGEKSVLEAQRQVRVKDIETGGFLSLIGISEASVSKGIELIDEEARACWTVQALGTWSIALMGAEWAGGRETAMLAGGSAGVPPWWMAFVSLFMSVVFLFIQYPLMYRLYHRDDDDLLSDEQTSRLIDRTLQSTCDGLHLRYNSESTEIEVKPLIISIHVSYENTDRSFSDRESVRARLLKDILSEFAVFGEMRSTELDVQTLQDRRGVHQSIREGLESIEGPVEDYTSFFTDLNNFARIDDSIREVVRGWFAEQPLHHIKDNVTSDDFAVYLRVNYRPGNQILSFFRNSFSYEDVQRELRKTIRDKLGGMLGDRRVIVSAVSDVDTRADRVAAGRAEKLSVKEGDETVATEAFVAKQEGITGTLLQNEFVADILSSVEFIA
ncbi:MAG: hypothetical protein VX854_06165, partial [Candidatus Thermoplasmatota archaeon]|nr:hypothetical protein [Candidatus Thermoplasmatota archaeon]